MTLPKIETEPLSVLDGSGSVCYFLLAVLLIDYFGGLKIDFSQYFISLLYHMSDTEGPVPYLDYHKTIKIFIHQAF